MKVQIFNYYQKLALDGNFKPISCYNTDHGHLITSYDMNKDEINLFCLECDYKVKPGINLYEKILERISEYDKRNS